MSVFQPVKFKSVEECIESLPADERILCQFLRQNIKEHLPRCTEKLSYNVPFFFGRKAICLLWPGNVPWGTPRPAGVELAFCHANQFSNELGWLAPGTRKQVWNRHFTSMAEVDLVMLKTYLELAWEWDQVSSRK